MKATLCYQERKAAEPVTFCQLEPGELFVSYAYETKGMDPATVCDRKEVWVKIDYKQAIGLRRGEIAIFASGDMVQHVKATLKYEIVTEGM